MVNKSSLVRFVRSLRLMESVWVVPVVVLSIIASMTAWFAYEEYKRALEREYSILEAHVRIAEGQMNGLLRHIEHVLKQVAERRKAYPAHGLADMEALLALHKKDLPEVRTLAVTNAEGRIVASFDPVLKGFDASRRDYFTAHRDRLHEPNFHITRPFRSFFGDGSVVFSVAIRDDGNRLLGVVIAGVSHRFFEHVIAQVRPPQQGGMVAVFNRHGDLLCRLPHPNRFLGTSIAGSDAFQRYLNSDLPMVRSISVALTDGVERLYVHRALGNTGLGLAVGVPLAQALAEWRINVILRALIVGLVAAVTLFLAWKAHRRQEEILEGKAFTEQLIETASVMVVGLNPRGEVVTFNEAAEQISGYRRDEVLGRTWFDCAMPAPTYAEACRMFRTAKRTGHMPRSLEYPLVTKDGRQRTIVWRNSVILKDGAMKVSISFGIDITERTQMEKIRRNAEVSHRLVCLQEEERRRLAIELHDRTSPNLSALEINWRLLANSVRPHADGETAHLLDDASALIDDTIESIRTISTEFRPAVLDHAGFWPAVEGYAQHFSRRTGIAVRAEADRTTPRLPPEVETNLFRIVQEALANCAKHSRAKQVRIGQVRSGNCIKLAIVDDGAGFDPQRPREFGKTAGHGLLTMQKRAEFIGGRFSLESRPGKGTQIAVEVLAMDAAESSGMTGDCPRGWESMAG